MNGIEGVASTPFSDVGVSPDKKTAVVFVHGLFLNGAEFTLLRRRVAARHGFQTHRFSYPTVRGAMSGAIARLERFVDRIDADQVHFVGHSLGGIVLTRYFQLANPARPGRVVLLGSPLVGSGSARAVARHAVLRRVIGPLVNADAAASSGSSRVRARLASADSSPVCRKRATAPSRSAKRGCRDTPSISRCP